MQKIFPGDIFLIFGGLVLGFGGLVLGFGGLVLGLGLAHTYFSSTAVRACPGLSLMKQLRCNPAR